MNEQEILCFADIQAEEVKWLWYPYIPYGKITILQGDPGCGKTMAVLSLAALLSKGESLPFEEAVREPINILYQTSEDGIADTIKPRLESAGANCTRIKIINEEKRALTFDDPRLEQSILQENARLLILDPLSAYIGPTVSMNQANEVRGAFRSLYAMAQRTRCAVLIVAHMNKMSGISALYRTSGSIDIAGAVRSILTVTRYQRSPTQRVLVPVKSNDYDGDVETSTAQSISVIFAFITGIIKMARDNRNATDENAKLLSSEPYPLVMDAPLSAFDKRRIKTVCEALPSIAEQVIIFIKDTDGELAEKYMGDKIGCRHYFDKKNEFETTLV